MREILALVCVLVLVGTAAVGTASAVAKTPATTHSAGWVKAILCLGAVGTFISQRRPNAGGVIRFGKRLWNAKSAKALGADRQDIRRGHRHRGACQRVRAMTARTCLIFVVGLILAVVFWITLKPVFGVLAFLLLVIITPWPDEVEEPTAGSCPAEGHHVPLWRRFRRPG